MIYSTDIRQLYRLEELFSINKVTLKCLINKVDMVCLSPVGYGV